MDAASTATSFTAKGCTSVSIFLSVDELTALTGCKGKKAQAVILHAQGIPHWTNRLGVVVLREWRAAQEGKRLADMEATERAEYSAEESPWQVSGSTPNRWHEDNRPAFEMSLNRILAVAESYPHSKMAAARTAVYFLLCDDELLYVGMSVQPAFRVDTHRCERRIPFNRVAFVEVQPMFLSETELFYIDREQPPYNVRGIRYD